MSAKNRDKYQRWRCHTIAFRMSPEESQQLDIAVKLSGLTKQDYVCNRCLERDVVVQGNPRVYKALKEQLGEVTFPRTAAIFALLALKKWRPRTT